VIEETLEIPKIDEMKTEVKTEEMIAKTEAETAETTEMTEAKTEGMIADQERRR
jgi:hypothetical protein